MGTILDPWVGLSILTDLFRSLDLLVTLATKRTPVFDVHVTQRNLVMAAGVLE